MTDTRQGGPFSGGQKQDSLPKNGWNHLKGSNQKPKQNQPKSEGEDSEDLSKD